MSAEHLDLLARQIDDTAAAMAGLAYLQHLTNRREVDFWALPEVVQADVVAIGCDAADQARDAFASVHAQPGTLADVWRYAAQRFQAHVDRFLLGAGHGGGRA